MAEINGFKVSDSVFEQLSFKKEPVKKENEDLGQADFMQLLITQLKNQDPLAPQDHTAFVAQLAQFSTLQGIENMNANFDSMHNSLKSNQAIQASALVGHTVLVDTNVARLTTAGEVLGSIDVSDQMDDTLLNIYNTQGALVRQELLGPQEEGELRFAWDGRNEAGESMPAGFYRFEALGMKDGEAMGLQTTMGANVNSVTIGATGDMTLNVDGVGPMAISAVKEIL